jgi:hypothetical protein
MQKKKKGSRNYTYQNYKQIVNPRVRKQVAYLFSFYYNFYFYETDQTKSKYLNRINLVYLIYILL